MRAAFVGGCPRSGTTLLGALLGSHTDCLCVPESHFKIDALRAGDIDLERVTPSRAIERMKQDRDFLGWEGSPALPEPADAPVVSYAELIEWLVRRYGAQVGKPAPKLWVDHTPDNARYASTLFSMFPDAKMIHIVRDGRAVAASVMPLHWGPNRIDQAARYWLFQVGQGLAAEACWGPERVARIRYEDLVVEPEAVLQRLCAFLEIDYQPGMLRADGFTVPAHMRTPFPLIGKPPDPRRIDAWRTALTAREIELFEDRVDDFLQYFGYPSLYGLRARPLSRREQVESALDGIRRHARRWVLYSWRRLAGRAPANRWRRRPASW
ncbi:MAG TPA: sulfotransferase [Candidatus Methylomirabilis sp.]|nr:sulfotransferase [Candidatus Methylomirabilis sp.]